ncbi:hypothetical protein ACFDR8_003579 [Arthrobacter sp. MP_2.3]
MSHRWRIGTIEGARTPAELDARRLNRHTFRCGQSGSGITCALGALPRAVALDHRWEKREEPRPLLVVIDEAHNVCASTLSHRFNGSSPNGSPGWRPPGGPWRASGPARWRKMGVPVAPAADGESRRRTG